MNKRVMAWSVE